MIKVTLASASASRAAILKAAGVAFEAVPARVDEAATKADLLGRNHGPREIADKLAQMKAMEVSLRRSGLVIGADQTLELDGVLYDKPRGLKEAGEHLTRLRGRTHALHAAVVLASDGAILWRQSDTARLTMRPFSNAFLSGYLRRNGERVLGAVGGYQLEGEGAQLFDRIEGDYFSILGLPLLGLLKVLRNQAALET